MPKVRRMLLAASRADLGRGTLSPHGAEEQDDARRRTLVHIARGKHAETVALTSTQPATHSDGPPCHPVSMAGVDS